VIDVEAELDRLTADLAVLDVACRAGTRVNWRLEALPAIRALDQLKLHAAWGAAIRGYARVDHRIETVLSINALRIARFHGAFGWLLVRDWPLHRLTIRPTAGVSQFRIGSATTSQIK
jgi:hypothetical protein